MPDASEALGTERHGESRRRGGRQAHPHRHAVRLVGDGQQPDATASIQRERYRVTVFGSARTQPGHWVYQEVKRMSAALSAMGCDIVTGGGPGLMQAANEGAREVHGHGASAQHRHSRDAAVRTGRPIRSSRKLFEHQTFFTRLHHFVLTSDAFIVAPGGIGTVLESMMIWQLLQVRHLHDTPLIFAGPMWKGLVDWAKAGDAASGLRTGLRARHADPALRGRRRSKRSPSCASTTRAGRPHRRSRPEAAISTDQRRRSQPWPQRDSAPNRRRLPNPFAPGSRPTRSAAPCSTTSRTCRRAPRMSRRPTTGTWRSPTACATACSRAGSKRHAAYAARDVKVACYLSAEFLIGPQLGNNLVNLGIETRGA